MQSNPSQAAPASSTISLPYNNQQNNQQNPAIQAAQPNQEKYWAGNSELTQFLEENGLSSIQDLLQYTAGQEQSAEQLQEIFEYAMHPDPEVRGAFWQHYQEALQEQGVIGEERNYQDAPNAPNFPGTPYNDNYNNNYNNATQGFAGVDQFAQQFALMNSGLPIITPQSLAEFDRAILMTPGSFWARNVFDFGDI